MFKLDNPKGHTYLGSLDHYTKAIYPPLFASIHIINSHILFTRTSLEGKFIRKTEVSLGRKKNYLKKNKIL